jgi:ribosome-associated heat shock protein Hsp15
MDSVRIDKWLWAARFYKTRSQAKQAIESGKVKMDGQRVKASKDLVCGLFLTIKIGWDDKEIEVLALSDVRRGASEAQCLYQETTASIERRAQRSAERDVLRSFEISPAQRPTKKQRRQIHKFREQDFGDS